MKLVVNLTNGAFVVIRYVTYSSHSVSGNYLSVEFNDDVHPAYATKIAHDLNAVVNVSEDARFCTFFLASDAKVESMSILAR